MVLTLLTVSVLANVFQTLCNKEYGKQKQCSSMCFALCSAFASLVFFAIRTVLNFSLDKYTFLCALLCAIGLIGSLVGFNNAVKYGSLAISGLIQMFSLALPTLYGITVLKEPIGRFTILGIILLVVSLVLINFQKESFSARFKWALWMSVSFFCNGLFATVQKAHQVATLGTNADSLMLFAFLCAVLVLLVYVILFEREIIRCSLIRSYYSITHGVINGLNNMSLLKLATLATAALVYPLITVAELIILSVLSVVLYKEKLLTRQWIGVGVGIISAVFLSV